MRIAMIGTRGVPARYGGFETAVEEVGRRLTAGARRDGLLPEPQPDAEQLPGHAAGQPAGGASTESWRRSATPSVRGARADQAPARRRDRLQRRQRPVAAMLKGRRIPSPCTSTGWSGSAASGAGGGGATTASGVAGGALGRRPDRRRAWHRRVLRGRVRVPTELIPYGAPIGGRPGGPAGARPVDRAGTTSWWRGSSPRTTCGRSSRATSPPRRRSRSSSSAPRRTPTSTRARSRGGRGRPAGAAAGRRLGPGAARPALRARADLHARALGGRDQPVTAARHGGRDRGGGLRRGVQPRGPRGHARYFAGPVEVSAALLSAEAAPDQTVAAGERLRRRASERYDWDAVASDYEKLAEGLLTGRSTRGVSSGRRASSRPAR